MRDDDRHYQETAEPRKMWLLKDGRIYFSKATERKLFFALTIIILILLLFSKLGWL